MVSSQRWLLNLRLDKKIASIYNEHKETAHKVIELVLIEERL